MKLRLPPCVKKFVKEGPESASWKFALQFVKTYDPGLQELAKEIGDEELAHDMISQARKVKDTFSCFAVMTARPDACDMSNCPLFHNDPVSFMLSYVDKAVYNHATSELKLYFHGNPEPLVVKVTAIAADRRTVLGEIARYTLEYFETPIVLAKYTDDDGVQRDPLADLIQRAYKQAIHVREDDLGVSELILELYERYPPMDVEAAKSVGRPPEAFIYVDRRGRYYAILSRLVRSKAKSTLNISSIRKLNELLRRFGIEKRRLTLSYARAYYYLVPFEIFVELVGKSPDETPSAEVPEEIKALTDDWSYLSDDGGD